MVPKTLPTKRRVLSGVQIMTKILDFITQNQKRELRRLEKLAAQREREDQELLHEAITAKEKVLAYEDRLIKKVEQETKSAEHYLDLKIAAIQKSTRTSFSRLAPIHNYLRTKSKI